jgi:hypothetical protein
MKHPIRTSATSFAAGLALAAGLLLATAVPAAADTYGDGVTVAEPTPIAAILADPDAFEGKRVRIEGRVAEVCPRAGCWMELAADEGETTLRVKVQDGVIVFPADAVGRVAVAEGVVEIIPMDRDAYRSWLEHLAEERGETFDAAELGDGPFRRIQIRGTGAEIPAG